MAGGLRLIISEESLFKILLKRNLDLQDVEMLAVITEAERFPEEIENTIEKAISNSPSKDIIDLVVSLRSRPEIQKFVFEKFYSKKELNEFELDNLITRVRYTDDQHLVSMFLVVFLNKVEGKFQLRYLDIAIAAGNLDHQKKVFKLIRFDSESDFLNFVESGVLERLSAEVKGANDLLSGFVHWIKGTANRANFSEDAKAFLRTQEGVLQSLSAKFLINQYYLKKLSREDLHTMLSSFQWTDISCLLIKAFFENTDKTEKILVSKLTLVFKEHFNTLAQHQYKKDAFQRNFSIGNILNQCDGRKHYQAEYWNKNGVTRWYYKGARPSLTFKEPIHGFCEGRPWKQEPLWDADTNQQTIEPYPFYWCKNSYCAQRNDTMDLSKPFHQWTIMEFSQVLNFKLEKLTLSTLAGWANRMNQITDHLFCRSCQEVLRPIAYTPATLGYYAVPLFNCINSACALHGKVIRFTHCQNSKCPSHLKSSPLDSRDCKSCRPGDPNHTGLECPYCGQACPACTGQDVVKVQSTW